MPMVDGAVPCRGGACTSGTACWWQSTDSTSVWRSRILLVSRFLLAWPTLRMSLCFSAPVWLFATPFAGKALPGAGFCFHSLPDVVCGNFLATLASLVVSSWRRARVLSECLTEFSGAYHRPLGAAWAPFMPFTLYPLRSGYLFPSCRLVLNVT